MKDKSILIYHMGWFFWKLEHVNNNFICCIEINGMAGSNKFLVVHHFFSVSTCSFWYETKKWRKMNGNQEETWQAISCCFSLFYIHLSFRTIIFSLSISVSKFQCQFVFLFCLMLTYLSNLFANFKLTKKKNRF